MSSELKPSVDELKELFNYNPETGELSWKKSIANPVKAGRVIRTKDTKGRYRVEIRGRSYAAHHVCFAIYHGWWPKDQIDHMNQVKTDNRIVNLREATNAQNARNRKNSKPNNTGYKGVCLHKGRYIARIMADGVSKHLGMFNDPVEAAKAYNDAAILLHGDFACLGELPSGTNEEGR